MADREEYPSKVSVSRQAVPQLPWRAPGQSLTIILLIVLVGIIIGALYLAQATVTATTGSALIELVRTRDFLQRANADTISQIAFKRNINVLRGRAQELGFVPAGSDELEYIVVPGYLPVRATATPVITPVPTVIYDETFSGWLKLQWDALVEQFEQWLGAGQPTPIP